MRMRLELSIDEGRYIYHGDLEKAKRQLQRGITNVVSQILAEHDLGVKSINFVKPSNGGRSKTQ